MKIKKVIAVLLTTTAVLGLAACGSQEPANTADQSGTTTTEAGAASTTEQAEKERQTISFSVIDVNAGTNHTGDYADEIEGKIEEYTGVDLDLIWYPNDALAEKNSLAMTNPDTMPQIMSWGGTMTGDVVKAAKNGAFVDLNEYINDAEKYPNLSKMSDELKAQLTVDGKLIAIPRTRVVGRYGLSYRQDWADKLGVSLPENATPDDVYKMLYAFTYDDPDGNGKDDTIGMEMTLYTGPFDIIQTWFGCGNDWQDVNGELQPVWTTDSYFEALDYIKKLYDDGLMPKDFYSRPTDSWSNGCKTGENGVYIDVLDGGKRIWQYFEADETFTPSVMNPDEGATMNLYGAVNQHTLATAGYAGFFTLSQTTLDSPEKIEAALTLLDKLNDYDMLVLTQYGLEDVNYKMENGKLVDTDKDDEVLGNNYKGLNQILAYLPSAEVTDQVIPIDRDKYNLAQVDAYAKAYDYAEINPALSYLVNSETYANVGADLDTKVDSLRTQYICGEIDSDKLHAELDAVMQQGYADIVSEVNEQYKANK